MSGAKCILRLGGEFLPKSGPDVVLAEIPPLRIAPDASSHQVTYQ